jgi:eukaryotic-like serine/threonine-protein kinase
LDSPPSVQPGDLLASKYRVERVLGQGGMGMVVAARHEQLGFHVALKFMLPAALGDEAMKERFLREARAAGSLRSEHVARVTDFGTLDTGAPYIVMEFLDGADLSETLSRVGHFPVHQAAEYVLQVCKAMEEAHALGIVHRDLKPQNLFLTHRPDGSPLVKVLDFGISKLTAVADGSVSVTSSQSMMGSPLYMAPEQIRSAKNVDARADIYSLGVILYQLTTGVTPVQAETLGELFENIFTKTILPLRERDPSIPADFDALVMRCLARDPGGRLATVKELSAGLAPFVDPRRSMTSIPAGTLPNSASPDAAHGSSTTLGRAAAVSERSDSLAQQKRGSWGWVVVGAVAAAVGAGGVLVFRSQTHPTAAATGAPSSIPLPTPAPLSVPSVTTSAPVVLAASAVPSAPVAASEAPGAAPSPAFSHVAKAKTPPLTPKSGPALSVPAAATPPKPAHTSSDPFASPD